MEIYKRKNIPWRTIEDQAVAVNPKTSLVYPLNAVAARIWQLIDGIKDINEISELICQEFEVGKTVAKSDTISFISQLKDAGLIEKI